MVRHQISQTSALRFGRWQEWNVILRAILVRGARGLCFIDEISRNGWLDSMILRDLWEYLWFVIVMC